MKKQCLKASVLVLGLLASSLSMAQDAASIEVINRTNNLEALDQMAEEFKKESEEAKIQAVKIAKEKGWEIKGVDENGAYFELMSVTKDGHPIYNTTSNVAAARSTRASTLHRGGILGLNVEGQGMTGYVWDGGHCRAHHQEFKGKVSYGADKRNPGFGDHASHVMGTVLAKGVLAKAKGMAPKAKGVSYAWGNDSHYMAKETQRGMLLSNHSYGFLARKIPDLWFGHYSKDSYNFDKIMYNAPNYVMVCAAGNDGNDDRSNSNPIGGSRNYDKLSGKCTAKNNIVVANYRDANIDNKGNLINVSRVASSSEGPCDDLRIKPDIAGNGFKVYSTNGKRNNSYQNMTGTSMASPNVMGTLLLLQQHYKNVNRKFMRGATAKGLALHTADDIEKKGPDALSGWGLMNAKAAATAISQNGKRSSILEKELTNGKTHQYNVQAIRGQQLRVSISWTDLPGQTGRHVNDDRPVLVNDLDLTVSKGPRSYSPWKLTGVNSSTKGDNDVDPFERIEIDGANGKYVVKVSHDGKLTKGRQKYTLIVTGGVVGNSPVNPVDPRPNPNPGPGNCKDNSTEIFVKPGAYGYEISYKVLNSANKVVASGKGFKRGKNVTTTKCLPNGCYKLQVSDSYGDGFSGGGRIALTVKGKKVAEVSGRFNKSKTVNFCLGKGNPNPTPPDDRDCVNGSKSDISFNSGKYGFEISWAIKSKSGKTMMEGKRYRSNQAVSKVKCLPKGCYTLTLRDSSGDGFNNSKGFFKIVADGAVKANVRGNFGKTKTVNFCVGKSGPNPNPNPTPGDCAGEKAEISFNSGKHGSEISFYIENTLGVKVLSKTRLKSNQAINMVKCLPKGCYKFVIKDRYGDGFSKGGFIQIRVAGQLKADFKGNFGKKKSTFFCVGDKIDNSIVVGDEKANLDMLVYPNPAKSAELVKLNSTDILTGTYSVFTFDGNVVSKGEFKNGAALVNVKGLQEGTYLVKVINSKGQSVTKQLIIQD